MNNKSGRNMQIEGLRGASILYVVFYHYIYRYSELFDTPVNAYWMKLLCGGVFVPCFLFISSFFLISSKNTEPILYLKKKIIRLWPAYFLSICITFIVLLCYDLPGRECSLKTFIGSIFGISGFLHGEYVDGAHWYLTVLVGLILTMTVFQLLKIDRVWWIYLILEIVSGVFLHRIFPPLYRVFGGVYLGMAVMGISYRLYIEKNIRIVQFIILITSGCLYTFYRIGYEVGIFLPFAFLLFYLCQQEKLRIINNAIFRVISFFSYAWYLIHQNIGFVVEHVLKTKYGIPLWTCIIAAIVISFSLAVIITYIDNRLQKVLTQKNFDDK